MTDRRRIEYRTDMDSKGFERGSRTVTGRLKDMGRGLQRDGVVGFGQLSQAVGISAMDLVQFGRRAGEFIWDLTLTGGAVETVAASFEKIFGPAAVRLREELDETRRSMGLSRGEMESMILPMGQMATNAGFAADKAGDLAGKLLTMAGDVATFNPLIGDSAQALTAMQAALRGEFDPLERFGSKLTAARVKAEAARLKGIDPLNASLSDQQVQIMAVVSLLEQDFAPAMGSLEAAEGTAADSANELNAAMKDLKENTGRLANQALPPLVNELADVIENASKANEQGGYLNAALQGLRDTAWTVITPLPSLIGLIRDTGEAAEKTEERVVPSFNGIRDAAEDAADEVYRLKGALDDADGGSSTYEFILQAKLDAAAFEAAKAQLAELGIMAGNLGILDRGWLVDTAGREAAASAEESGRRYQDDIDRWNQANGDGPGIG